METCYVRFGQKYRHEPHPIDSRAHPDGWFEFSGRDYNTIVEAVWKRMLLPGYAVPEYRSATPHKPSAVECPRGCLARFEVTPGVVMEVTR